MKDILFFIILTYISYGMGRLLLSIFIKEPESLLEDFVFSSALGFGVVGYLVYTVGSLGFLRRGPILIFLIAGFLLSLFPGIRFVRGLKFRKIVNAFLELGEFEKFLSYILILIPAISFFGAMAPAIGNDALAYHLQHSKIFVERGSIGLIPFTRESLWPYFGQMFFTLGLLFESVTAAKLSHYFFGILLLLSVFSFTRRFFSRKAGLLASALLISSPGIFTQMMYAYVDLTQAFYSFMALYLILLWFENERSRLLALSGIFMGLALSVKLMSGIALISIFAIILLAAFLKKVSFRKFARSIFIFGFFAFIAGFVWYLRSYLVLGNPVYPFLHNVFGSGWETNINADVGMGRNFIGFIRLPWDMVIYPDNFGGEQIGVIFLAFFPMLFFLPRRNKNVLYLLVFLIIFGAIWLVLGPMSRFAFVNFAVAFILVSVGFYSFDVQYASSFIKKLLIFCIVFNLLLCVYHNFDAISLAVGRITQEEYLAKKERTYPVAGFINRNTPTDSVIIVVGEPRGFYFDRQIIHYEKWQRQTDKDILVHADHLISKSIPVYLLYRSDADYDKFLSVLDKKRPLKVMEREVDRGKKATYYLYRL
jgi:hypothetical protein